MRKIVITSGKGGVGKTTVTSNLGIALALLGQRVCLVDIDFGLNNLDVVMGVENRVVYNLIDVINGSCRAKQALVQDVCLKNLYILPSGTYDSSNRITGQNIKLLIDSFENVFDYVLFDCPAGIDVGFHRAISCVDEAIVVTMPNLTSIRDADKVISILNSYQLKNVGLVINRVRGDLIMSDKMLTPFDIQNLLKIDLLGVLPDDDMVMLSSGYSLPRRSDSGKAYRYLASNVHKGTKKIFNVTKKYSGFFGSIRRSLKRSI